MRPLSLSRPFESSIVPVFLIAASAGVLGGLYLAFITLRAGDSMHFDVTPLSTAFAFMAGLAIASGVAALLRLREASLGARFALAIGLLVFGGLAIFSIGLAIIPFALLLLGFAVRQLLRRRSGRAVRAAFAGALIGVGLVAYLLVLNQPAVAACGTNGGSTSSGGLFGSASRSSGGYSTVTGESGGFIDEGDRIAYFSCRDGKLVDFYRLSLPQGQWVVTTQPAATVGRSVMVVFRLRTGPGVNVALPTDGFDFSATCWTCPEPRPVVRGHVIPSGTHEPIAPGDSVAFTGPVIFPAAGSWYTSPYDAPIDVR
jgi:hypothetical protein